MEKQATNKEKERMKEELVEKLTNEYEQSYKMWTSNQDWVLTPDWFYQFLQVTETEYQELLDAYKDVGVIPPTVFKNHLMKQIETISIGPPKRQLHKHTTEYIDAETKEYVKENYLKNHRVRLYLRFCGEWIDLCDEDQNKIYEALVTSRNVILGNEDYNPPIELRIGYDSIDDSWIEVERRKATKNELKTLKEI